MAKPDGEATPPANNTVAINPLTFDEAALAKALKTHLNPVEEPKDEPPKEPPAEPVEPEAPEPPGEPVEEPAPAEEQPAEEGAEQVEGDDSQGVQKRINKLTAQKKEALEKAEALEREVNELKAKVEGFEQARPAVTNAANPHGDIWEESKLREKWDQARALKRWCEDNIDGAEVNGREYSAEEIRAIRRNVEDALEVGIPQRAAFLHQYRQVKPEAEKIYPFWKDRNSAQYAEAQVVLKELPAISQLPDYQVLIGDFLVGRAVRLAKAKQPSAAPKLPPKAPKQPTTTPSAAPRAADGERAQYEAKKEKFLRTGSVTELAHLLKGQI